MGADTTRPLDVVQTELHYLLDELPRLRIAFDEAAPGQPAVDADREYKRERARFDEVFAEFIAHVTPRGDAPHDRR